VDGASLFDVAILPIQSLASAKIKKGKQVIYTPSESSEEVICLQLYTPLDAILHLYI
jgi:hypothetical protein